MQPGNVYCSQCGAENRPQATYCSRCRYMLHPAKMETGKIPPGYLLHKQYRIVQLIDKGGMGAVYKAEDINLNGRPVAIKEMSQSKLRQDEIAQAVEMFKQEAQLLAGLNHPNLPSIFNSFGESGRWYLVMAFIEGTTLDDRLKTAPNHVLSILDTLDIGIQLTKVLGYLHTRRSPIIFRDLKPLNIMITPERNVYLIDFGIVRYFTPGKHKDTVPYATKGYAPPEQYGSDQTSPQSDIYSLGVTLYQMLSGQDPQADSFSGFRPLQSYNGDIPRELANLIATMLNSEATQRPANMADVKEKLEQIQMQVRQDGQQKSQNVPLRRNIPLRSSPPLIENVDDTYDVDLEEASPSPIRKRASLHNQPPFRTPTPIIEYEDEDGDEYDVDYEYDVIEPDYTPIARRTAPAPFRTLSYTPTPLIENRNTDVDDDYEEAYTPVRRPRSRPLSPVRAYTPVRSQTMSRSPSRPSRSYPAQRQAARIAQSGPEDWFPVTIGIALLASIVAAFLYVFKISIIITLLSPLFIKFDIISLLVFFIAGTIMGRMYKLRFSCLLLGAIAGTLLVLITFLFAGMQDVYSLHLYTSILLYMVAGALCSLLGALLTTI